MAVGSLSQNELRSWAMRGAALATPILFILAVWWAIDGFRSLRDGPAPETVASASLQGLREQNRLSAFAANYAAVVTSEQRRFGLSAKKTLIMQGLVRYEVDLAKLGEKDVRWDADTGTLRVKIPPIETAPPQIDLKTIQEYGENGILRAFTDVDDVLDDANRDKGLAELTRQANGPVPMTLAREAFKRAVKQNFEAPLRAAGLDAKVEAYFADELGGDVTTRWDESTPLEEILKR
ncbi:MAG TPA: DUF4230 domain-containing protein [Sphingorhabdus sp.]|jgi:hypothetical protein|uniref:DUF4230 domain-containing protein n=1 Tax=Sphingorhabdus sp. TaxID=1902408 RepID=UPI002C0A889B|nr:DUF4230 domain-containing protein [Sphingorhabdus sp.]HMT42436.1 DUF4230 domain-containing protein [Sphingorhabdus sp.]HMU20638.1 DUF4230 domain-containing protein [Sphingorhabdus sp.]